MSSKETESPVQTRILIVEDDKLSAEHIHSVLTKLGYEVCGTCSSGEEAIKEASVRRPDLVLMDIVLQGEIDGIKAAEQISSLFDVPVVYLTAHVDENVLQRAKITEPYGFILKPFAEKDLHINIEIALYRHRMSRELKESRERAEEERVKVAAIIEAIGDVFSIQDRDFRFLYMNRVAKNLFGDRIGEYCYQVYEGLDHVCDQCPLTKSFVDGRLHRTERLNASGTMHIEITASPVRDASGRIVAGIELARDITKRKKAEEALRESEERYRNLFESAHDMIQSFGPEGQFNFVNSAWLKIMGYSVDELKNMTLFDILHPSCLEHCAEIFKKVMAGEAADNIEAVFVAKDGRLVEVEGNVTVRVVGGKVIATQGIFRDITERKRAEEERIRLEHQLRHSQKMEAIGSLTARISHEFKNYLTTIIGYSEFIQDGLNREDPLRMYADMVYSSAQRAEELTQGLLAYSRKQIINTKPVRLNDIAERVIKLFSRLSEVNIKLEAMLTAEDIIIQADPAQIEQVLMNLSMNAKDAMPNGGTLALKTDSVELDRSFREIHGYGRPGKYALVSVSDSGVGVAEKDRKKIFEPFFTTKEAGKGTGLGLAVVYGIIKQHGGYIHLSSQLGKGSTFDIYLPLISDVSTGGRQSDEDYSRSRQKEQQVFK